MKHRIMPETRNWESPLEAALTKFMHLLLTPIDLGLCIALNEANFQDTFSRVQQQRT